MKNIVTFEKKIQRQIDEINTLIKKIKCIDVFNHLKIVKLKKRRVKSTLLIAGNTKITPKKLEILYSLYYLLDFKKMHHYIALNIILNKKLMFNDILYIRGLFSYIQSNKDCPLKKSIIFYYDSYRYSQYLHISDNNKISDRFLLTYILYEWENIFAYIPIEIFIEKNKSKFFEILDSNQIQNRDRFILFMLNIIRISCQYFLIINHFTPYMSKEYRQNRLIKEILLDENITLDTIAKNTKSSIRTIKRDVDELKSLGLLSRKGSKKTGTWEVMDDSLAFLKDIYTTS